MASDDLIPPQRLRTMQIIAAALPAGVLMFLAVVLFLVYGTQNAAAPAPNAVGSRLPILSIVAGFFFLVTAAMSFVLPGIITQTNLKQIAAGADAGDVSALLGLRQTTLIIGIALLEGACFFGLIAFLIERQPLVLLVPGLGLLAMLARFPTENSVRAWMETHARRVLELRQGRLSR